MFDHVFESSYISERWTMGVCDKHELCGYLVSLTTLGSLFLGCSLGQPPVFDALPVM